MSSPQLREVIPYNHNTTEFAFELPNSSASLTIPVASCIVIKSSDPQALKDDKGAPIIRAYTPIPSPETEIRLLIKRYEQGNASKYIHSLKPGDSLAIKGPIAKWPYKTNEFDHVALIGGGSGITPLYQVITHALADPANTTKFTLLYGNVTEADILLRKELDALKAKYPSTLEVLHVLNDAPEGWNGLRGFITKDIIEKYVAAKDTKVKVFICGPPPQVAALAGPKDGGQQGALAGVLKDLGYSEEQVFKF